MERFSQIQQVNSAIMFGNFTNDELNSIADAVKFARTNIAKQNKRAMNVGTVVKFTNSKTGMTIIGTVKKVNRKFILVNEQKSGSLFGSTWRVPASMLSVA
jgi:predicted oxidoreductase (fatty acid repression mutant protein)